MSDLTPTQLAIARALVGDDWDNGIENTDIGDRAAVASYARCVEDAVRPLIEAEVLAMPATFGELTPAYEGVDREALQPAVDAYANTYKYDPAVEQAIEAAYQFARRRAARIAGGGPSRG